MFWIKFKALGVCVLMLFSNNDINFIDMNTKTTITVAENDPFGQSCKYNEVTDTAKVIPGLATDINDMLKTGIVRDGEISLDNNGIDDPEHIIGRCSDQFDAIEAARAIKKYGKNKKKALEEVSKAVETPANPSGSGSDNV